MAEWFDTFSFLVILRHDCTPIAVARRLVAGKIAQCVVLEAILAPKCTTAIRNSLRNREIWCFPFTHALSMRLHHDCCGAKMSRWWYRVMVGTRRVFGAEERNCNQDFSKWRSDLMLSLCSCSYGTSALWLLRCEGEWTSISLSGWHSTWIWHRRTRLLLGLLQVTEKFVTFSLLMLLRFDCVKITTTWR